MGSHKASKDARLSVSAADKVVIVEQSEVGESQKQLAADFGISQQRVSQIVTAAKKKAEKRKKQRVELEAFQFYSYQLLIGNEAAELSAPVPCVHSLCDRINC